MSAKSKDINKTNTDKDQLAEIRTLANKLIDAIEVQKKLDPLVSETKKKLGAKCVEIFCNDLENSTIHGNFNFESSKGSLTVNLRLSSSADITQHQKILCTYLGDEYDDLFDEEKEHTLTASNKTLAKQFTDYPGMFSLDLNKGATHREIMTLFEKYPHLFTLSIRNMEEYAKLFPQNVTTKIKVIPKSGFIERLGKCEGSIKKRVANALKAFFIKNVETAVSQK